jgi:hypothetical protein
MERTIRSGPQRPRLLDQVRDAMRRKHYSLRTEESYIHWIKRFIYDREIVRAGEREMDKAARRDSIKA